MGIIALSIKIRVAKKEDHREILAITDALHQWFDEDARNRAIPLDLLNQHVAVASLRGEVIGFITLFFAEGRINIGWFGVRPDSQRAGVGTQLLSFAEKFGRKSGVTEIATYTLSDSVFYEPYVSTRTFYLSHGFSIYQRNKTDNPSCPEEIKIKKQIA